MASQTKWTRQELILAFNLYCKIPFGQIHDRNPKIIELAKFVGRTPGAVSWKLVNFAHLDPSLDRKGASNVSKMDREIWQEFHENTEQLIFESEQLLAERKGTSLEKLSDIDTYDLPAAGMERERMIRVRVNQQFFRKMVLAAYDNRCCVTGLPVPELLVASHIIPWARDVKNRLNPLNGLCLNAFHDRAFDKGLIGISGEYTLLVSKALQDALKEEAGAMFFTKYSGKKICLPRRFIPSQEFLEYHRNNIFLGAA